MTKIESASIRREIRDLQKELTARARLTAREIKRRRADILALEREISGIERDSARLTVATANRVAILTGRLQS